MTAIGFRAEPSAINWAIVEVILTLQPVLVAAGQLSAPATYDEAAALQWFRDTVLSLLQTCYRRLRWFAIPKLSCDHRNR